MADLQSLDWLINAKLNVSSLEEPEPSSVTAAFSSAASAGLVYRIASNGLPTMAELPQQGGVACLVALAMLTPAAAASSSSSTSSSSSYSSASSALTATQAVRWIRTRCPGLHFEPAALRSAVRQTLSETGIFTRQPEAAPSHNTTQSGNVRPQRQASWRLADACRGRLTRLGRTASATLETFGTAVAQAIVDAAGRANGASPPAPALSTAVKAAGTTTGRKRTPTHRASWSSSSGSASPTGQKKRRGRRPAVAITTAAATTFGKKAASLAKASEIALDAILSGMSSPSSASDVESESAASSGEDVLSDALESCRHRQGSMDLDLDLLIGHMDDPVLSQLLAAEEDLDAATTHGLAPTHGLVVPGLAPPATPSAFSTSEFFALQLGVATPGATNKGSPRPPAHCGSVYAAALTGWEDCLRNLGDSFVDGDMDIDVAAPSSSDWLAASFSGIDFTSMNSDVDIVAL
jgi:hypothetical protein